MRKLVFALVLLFFVVSLIRNTAEYQKNMSFYTQTKANYEKAIAKNKSLKLAKTTSSSPFEIEKNLRNNENMVREHELIIIVPSPSPSPTPYLLPSIAPYRQWMRLFFK